MRPARAKGFVAVRCCIWAAAGAVMFGGGGCATSTQPVAIAPVRGAELVVENRTPYAWRLVFRTPAGVAVKEVNVAPRETGVVRIAGGAEYVIEQAIVTPGVGAAARSVAMRLEAGERYEWELATLLTSAGEESEREEATR